MPVLPSSTRIELNSAGKPTRYQVFKSNAFRDGSRREFDADGVGAVGALAEDCIERHSAGRQPLQPDEQALGMVRTPALRVVADSVWNGAGSPPPSLPRTS